MARSPTYSEETRDQRPLGSQETSPIGRVGVRLLGQQEAATGEYSRRACVDGRTDVGRIGDTSGDENRLAIRQIEKTPQNLCRRFDAQQVAPGLQALGDQGVSAL